MKIIPPTAISLGKRIVILTGVLGFWGLATALLGNRSQPNSMYRGRQVSEWVRHALDYENWQAEREARNVVIAELRERAVPYIVKEVRAECHSRLFYTLLRWQCRLPSSLRPLSEPEPRGKISCASHILGEMGDPAKPASTMLGRSLEESGMHVWEAQDVMTDLIGMGPAAKGALPWLRRIATDTRSWQCEQAALAIYAIEGNTNVLVKVVRGKLNSGRFSASRELFWFRGDEGINGWLLPMLCQAVVEPGRSQPERKEIIWHLAEVLTTNQLPRPTLEALLKSGIDDVTISEAKEALDTFVSHNAQRGSSKDVSE